ncbi:hypothetical protein glysoja_049889 [Glycine soja]|uniref:Uncharacterized protein n=1 Tax=Glycine soja TaxID=3848 RepID=A0A0B2RK58_GLYSO|nr:hypothetical protein glysoja_049889 [Glycine soja]
MAPPPKAPREGSALEATTEVAIANIALSATSSFFGCTRAYLQSLESCRFDKVKAVRYVVLQALKYWIILPAPPDTPNPSETGSSLKGALSYVVEYRGVHVRPSVGDLREEKYCSEGKDCYHGMITCLI